MPENNDTKGLPLFDYGERKKAQQLEEEREENQAELEKLHIYGPGVKPPAKPVKPGVETGEVHEIIARRKARNKAFIEKMSSDLEAFRKKHGIKKKDK